MMFFDPAYAYSPFGRAKRKKRKYEDNDILEKLIMFQTWLDSLEEKKKSKEPKKDDKKPDPKKLDTTGLAMFIMVVTFFAGQYSMLYLYQIFSTLPK